MTRHLLDITSLSDMDMQHILKTAKIFARQLESGEKITPRLQGTNFLSLFFENSTRTRVSFELAALRLGASFIQFNAQHSSLNKNESYHDTLANLGAMRPDGVILRHVDYNAPRFAAQIFTCPIINAGDSWRAHPTQALLDTLTLQESFGDDLTGKIITICGDIAHSRVARSTYELLDRLGAVVRIVAPALLMPKDSEFNTAERFTDIDAGLKGCDAVMLIRLQKERMTEDLGSSESTYHAQFGLTEERLNALPHTTKILSPGPINRGVEICDAAADDPTRSLILRQTFWGVPTRMAVLDWAINGI